ncbi:hypothetical protein JI664_16125 [Rhodobacter sp. NTK016B]|uniref:DUF6544 family protein n=1 Tax=Rhodobacter sp. NTK016B TaxID=2759676 RepID=UPI001A8C51D9|nr:DUF6544 family protein [Rhodobacter sp. NTK016B]MBN8293500.1 hypothetical protein [Rhodobacter sp. NTK016B]
MLKGLVIGVLGVLGLSALAVVGLTLRDRQEVLRLRAALLAARAPEPERYDPAMVQDLPEIAQRYFARAIRPGTPLSRVVTLRMEGTFLLNGQPLPMTARQILTPGGFIWEAAMGSGIMRIAGSDGLDDRQDEALGEGRSWTRFGIWGVIPVARAGGSDDHRRSARTRALLESVWTPAAFLPRFGAQWEQTGPDSARVSLAAFGDVPAMEITLNADGTLETITALRWSNANPQREYRLQPFGGRVLETRDFNGFGIPSRVEMGNLWGTPDYDGFFRATLIRAEHE